MTSTPLSRHTLAATLTFCVALTVIPSLLPGTALAQQLPADINGIDNGIITATNAYRAAKGSAALASNGALMLDAQRYAEYQARTNTSGHYADGQSPAQRVAATGYKACAWRENVYEYWSTPNQATAQTVIDAAMRFWINSPGHEANLRATDIKHIGVGVASWKHGDRNYYKVVQVFGNDCGASSAGGPVPSPGSGVLTGGPSNAVLAWAASQAHCKPGYVPRLTRNADLVCVTSDSRAQVFAENRTAASRVQPGGGAYGPNTCMMGYVWRDAYNGDGVCVTPARRDQVHLENRLAPTRVL